MSRKRTIVGREKGFAAAYLIFKRLSSSPKRSLDLAAEIGVSASTVKYVVRAMGERGCAVCKRGGGSLGGVSKAPGITLLDLFERFQVPFREGEEFEKEIAGFLSKDTSRSKKCSICEQFSKDLDAEWTCVSCRKLDEPIYNQLKMAKCGHLSASRYYKCETCQPILEDNDTPEDMGMRITL